MRMCRVGAGLLSMVSVIGAGAGSGDLGAPQGAEDTPHATHVRATSSMLWMRWARSRVRLLAIYKGCEKNHRWRN
jgi:hypothetical protein